MSLAKTRDTFQGKCLFLCANAQDIRCLYSDASVDGAFLRASFFSARVALVMSNCEINLIQVSFCASQRQGRLAASPAPMAAASPSIQTGCLRVAASSKSFACATCDRSDVTEGIFAERLSTCSAIAINSSPANTFGLVVLSGAASACVAGGCASSHFAMSCRVRASRALAGCSVDMRVEQCHVCGNLAL